MEQLVELVIPSVLQYGAIGLLFILLCVGYVCEKVDKNRLSKRLLEMQEARVKDLQVIKEQDNKVLEAIKDKLTELCYEIRSLSTLKTKRR